MKSSWKFILICFVMLLLNVAASAQCAMCKATAESATENVDKGIGEGLNAGIVYLMLIPYVLLATVALVFFRKKIMAIFRS
jgi:amino acid transporter